MQTVAGEADDRHPKFATGAEEAVIAWSAPHVWHPEAKVFINHALNDFFFRAGTETSLTRIAG